MALSEGPFITGEFGRSENWEIQAPLCRDMTLADLPRHLVSFAHRIL